MTLDEEKKLANRLVQGVMDLEEAKGYVLELVDQQGSVSGILKQALWCAAIVVYSRPFSQAKSGGISAKLLDAEKLGLFADRPDLLQVHRFILDMRQKVVAHTDWEHHRSELNTSGQFGAGITRQIIQTDYTRSDLRSFYDLVHHAAERVTKLSVALDKKLLRQP
jgi:hypothetical protein